MAGDETGGFPSGGALRRKGAHPMKVFVWLERFLVAKKGGIPSHVFGYSPFWFNLRVMKVDTPFKMYANRCYWEGDRGEDDLWVAGRGKTGVFSGSRAPDMTF